MRNLFVILALIAAAVFSFYLLQKHETAETEEHKIGGECTYVDYPGTCTITAVKQTEASQAQKTVSGGPGYAGYDVAYTYAPAEGSDPGVAGAGEHPLRLTNSWYPGEKYLSKYGIADGKSFACTLKVRKTGTCTPTVFEFPTIDLTDYFETVR